MVCVLPQEETVIHQLQVERLLDHGLWEAHQLFDQVALDLVRDELDHGFLTLMEEHCKVAKDHLVDESRHVEVF